MKNRLVIALLLLLAVSLGAQDQPKPPVDKPPFAPLSADPEKEKEKELRRRHDERDRGAGEEALGVLVGGVRSGYCT